MPLLSSSWCNVFVEKKNYNAFLIKEKQEMSLGSFWRIKSRSGALSVHFFSQVRRREKKRLIRDPSAGVDASSRHSATGQDSGFGSDSAHIRIVQIEQQSGASHHCIARPSHKSTITKNLNFIPFDIFLTASRLSVMTYACSSPPKVLPSSSDTPNTPERKEPADKVT